MESCAVMLLPRSPREFCWLAGSAAAATKTTTFTVNATVAANCNITAAPNLNFGNYDGSAVLTAIGRHQGALLERHAVFGQAQHGRRHAMPSACCRKAPISCSTTCSPMPPHHIWGDGTPRRPSTRAPAAACQSAQEKTHTVHGQLPEQHGEPGCAGRRATPTYHRHDRILSAATCACETSCRPWQASSR